MNKRVNNSRGHRGKNKGPTNFKNKVAMGVSKELRRRALIAQELAVRKRDAQDKRAAAQPPTFRQRVNRLFNRGARGK